jgi:AcrR family transcriptional regulator
MARPATQLREKILDAALGVLRKRGERGLTQTQVARAAGIPQGHLTYYFPKRRDLLIGVAERFAEVTGQEMRAFFVARADCPLAETMLAYVSRLARDRSRTRLVLGLLVISEEEPALAEVMRRNAGMIRLLLAPAIARPPDDPLVDLLLALLWGLGIHEFVLRSGDTDALLQRAVAMFRGPGRGEE